MPRPPTQVPDQDVDIGKRYASTAELAKAFSRMVSSSTPKPSAPVGPIEPPMPPVSAIKLPPESVLPLSVSIEPLTGFTTSSKGVGLLRKLSLYFAYLKSVYSRLEMMSSRPGWDMVTEELFGVTSPDEFLGHSAYDVPAHDSLGHFPLFRDTKYREYFDGCVGNPKESFSIDYNSRVLKLGMRIPRQFTRAHSSPGEATRHRLDQDPAFPRPGEKIKLRVCRIPFFPFYFDKINSRVASIMEEGSREMLRMRYISLQTNSNNQQWYTYTYEAVVIRTYSHRDASCAVDIRITDDTALSKIMAVQVMREEFSMDVTSLFLDLARYDERTGGRYTLALISYIKATWLPALSRWLQES